MRISCCGLTLLTLLMCVPAGAAVWSTPQAVNTDQPGLIRHDSSPRLATDGAGHWIVAWTSQNSDGTTTPFRQRSNVLVARTTDQGAGWSEPFRLNAPGEIATEPAFAVDPSGQWTIAWSGGDLIGAGSVRLARSTDHGTTWAAITANEIIDPGYFGSYSPDLAALPDGSLLHATASWNTNSSVGLKVLINRSAQSDPENWTSVSLLSGDQHYGNDSNLWNSSLAVDHLGNCVGIFNAGSSATLNGSKILFSRSGDHGLNWSEAQPLDSISQTTGVQTAPKVAADETGTWVCVWRKLPSGTCGADAHVAFSRSIDGGSTWSPPAPVDSSTPACAAHPKIAADGQGNWIAVWEAGPDLLYAVSVDNAQSWSPAAVLNPSAASDGLVSFYPQIAASGTGRWVAVWESAPAQLTGPAASDILSASLQLSGSTAATDWTLY